jgi:hypothetical protein
VTEDIDIKSMFADFPAGEIDWTPPPRPEWLDERGNMKGRIKFEDETFKPEPVAKSLEGLADLIVEIFNIIDAPYEDRRAEIVRDAVEGYLRASDTPLQVSEAAASLVLRIAPSRSPRTKGHNIAKTLRRDLSGRTDKGVGG